MREILFRGKRIDNGEWTEGYFFKSWGRTFLLWGMTGDSPNMIEVIPKTVGQYTGLTDKNGTKIFEGDRVLSEYGTVGIVEWDNEECSFLVNIGGDYQMLTDSEYVVTSNIHDNPELLYIDNNHAAQ